MTAGRPRKPNEVKKREGTYRKDRDRELSLQSEAPSIPPHLSDGARPHWDRLVPLLLNHQLLTAVDGDCLAMMCEALWEYQEAQAEIDRDGLTGMTDKGYQYINPGVSIRTNAWKKVCWCCRQFGMTPSARAGMRIVSNEKGDDGFEKAMQAASAALTREAETREEEVEQSSRPNKNSGTRTSSSSGNKRRRR